MWQRVAPAAALRRDGRRAARVGLLLAAWGLDLLIESSGPQQPSARLLGLIALTQLPVLVVLGLRRRRAGLGFGVAWAYCLVWSVALPGYQPFLVLLIAAYEPFRRWSAGPARTVLLLTAALFLWYSAQADQERIQVALVHLVVLLIPWLVAWNARRTEGMQQARQQAETALALHEERLRLARELHDTVSHAVTAMMWQATGARVRLGGLSQTELSGTLSGIESSGQQAIRELHRLLGLLRAADGTDPPHASLAQLDDLVQTVRSCGISVDLRYLGDVAPLAPGIDHVAYRVVQEALTNVMKYGGPGTHVEVELRWGPDELQLRIPSWGGTGAHPGAVSGGFGLAGLTERVDAVGGRLSAGWADPRTYQVQAWLPTG